MKIAWIDFETRSRCDLLTAGAYNYCQDLSTDVLCMAYAFDDEDVQLWLPGQPLPDFTGMQIKAHNAAFERLVFWYVLQQDYPLESFYCTAAQARANCAPGNLEDAGRFAGASMRKDHRGAQLIKLLSVPRPDGTFNNDPELLQEMYEYCMQDVRTMRSISKMLRPLSDQELADYHVNERINDYGVLVDVALAKSAVSYAAAELAEVQALVKDITNGEVTTVRSPRMKEWVQARVGPQALALMTGEDGKVSVDKNARANLLALAEEDATEVPPDVADVLQCASDIWSSSVAKFQRMAALADVEDHRVRGAFVFNGGAATGRYSSYGIQFQNMTRKVAGNPEEVRKSMLQGATIAPAHGSSVSEVLKSMIRPAIIPGDGNVFVVSDYSQIEARVTPWLVDAEDVLDVFRRGEDIYVKAAQGMFHTTTVTPNQRQVGKAASLSCSFGGGHKAFSAMGKVYGVVLPEKEARQTVDAWRKANPWAVKMWRDVEATAARAMRNKGHVFEAIKASYMYDGAHLWYALPSGRLLCYPHARFDEDGGMSYAKAAWKPKATDKHWPRAKLYSSVLVENVVQAVANDLLRGALRKCVGCVAHCHDEVVLSVPVSEAESRAKELERIMCDLPIWANGLPLSADTKIMARYGK